MSEKKTPEYVLDDIKNAFSRVDCLRMTVSAKQGQVRLEFTDEDVVGAIQALRNSMNKEEHCPICGERALKHEIRPVLYTYKEHTFSIDQPAQWCSACGEGIINPEDHKAVQASIQEEKARIDGLLTPQQIQKIRKFLKLNQKEASQLFGGGINAFNRYENGITPVPKPLSLLLTLLEKHPGQLGELPEYTDSFRRKQPLERSHSADRNRS